MKRLASLWGCEISKKGEEVRMELLASLPMSDPLDMRKKREREENIHLCFSQAQNTMDKYRHLTTEGKIFLCMRSIK